MLTLPTNEKYIIVLVPNDKSKKAIYNFDTAYDTEEEAKAKLHFFKKKGYKAKVTECLM